MLFVAHDAGELRWRPVGAAETAPGQEQAKFYAPKQWGDRLNGLCRLWDRHFMVNKNSVMMYSFAFCDLGFHHCQCYIRRRISELSSCTQNVEKQQLTLPHLSMAHFPEADTVHAFS